MENVKMTLGALVASGRAKLANNTSQDEWDRIKQLPITVADFLELSQFAQYVGVTEEFRNVLRTFPDEPGFIPAGFEPRMVCEDGLCVQVDLKRNIAYTKNGLLRSTNVLFSADSANPYEVAPMKNIVANLTCNPAIIYNLFINNPDANVGGKFKDRDEVIAEIGRILGSGADISVEVNDPFADRAQIVDEIERFKEILSPYRLVVKIPHTGPVNKQNAGSLVEGRFERGCFDGSVDDNLYGTNLAYFLQDKGYRINFTLMFEPHQAAISLQARPYFINTFLKTRYRYNQAIGGALARFDACQDASALAQIRGEMVSNCIMTPSEAQSDMAVLDKARWLVRYSGLDNRDGQDGLDASRHCLRLLRDANLPETRLILCSMDGYDMYPQIDKMLTEPEFSGMTRRVVVTAPPKYLSSFASAPGILIYQKLFLSAVKG